MLFFSVVFILRVTVLMTKKLIGVLFVLMYGNDNPCSFPSFSIIKFWIDISQM